MIRGFVIDERPYVIALATVHHIDLAGSPVAYSAQLHFLVDTGADCTVLSQDDCALRLGLPFQALPTAGGTSGVGGVVTTRSASGDITLMHDDGRLSVFPVTFAVLTPPGAVDDLPSSLLGRDVLRVSDLHLNMPRGEFTLEVP